MYEDSPEELVHDLLSETVWRGSSIRKPILGTRESLKNIDRRMIKEYMGERYISPIRSFQWQAISMKSSLKLCWRNISGRGNRKTEKQESQHVEFRPETSIEEKIPNRYIYAWALKE